jgi:hypothetical protein
MRLNALKTITFATWYFTSLFKDLRRVKWIVSRDEYLFEGLL